MSQASQKNKNEALGMNYSTASHRLRKRVMHSLLKECGRDKCFRCGQVIDCAEEVSIDHIVDWLNSEDPKHNFWNIENLAFSHIKCNTIAGSSRNIGKHGYLGVTKVTNNKSRPYQARYWDGKKQVLIGYYETAEKAAKAYDQKISEIEGGKARTNKKLGLMPG